MKPQENRHRNGVFFQSPYGLLPEHPISVAYGVLFIEPTNTYFFSSPVSFLIEPTRPMLRQSLPTMWNLLPASDQTHTDVPKMVGMAVPRRPTFSLLDVGRDWAGTVY
jgi:hypothetical protein